MKMCERCFEEYNEGEIYPSKYFNKLLCTPCEFEYEQRLKSFHIEFMNNQPERSKREDSEQRKFVMLPEAQTRFI